MSVTIPGIFDYVGSQIPEKECLVWRDRRYSWRDMMMRTNQLANLLATHGIGLGAKQNLRSWESPHDHVGLYLTNGNEYLEGLIASHKARAASFNINYRYTEAELSYLVNDTKASVLIFHGRYGPIVSEILRDCRTPPRLLLQVADESESALVPGAIEYESVLSSQSPTTPETSPAGDDRYLVYSGGTTGMPKAVIWRQEDFIASALGFVSETGEAYESVADLPILRPGRNLRSCPAPPFMHGAAQWNALSALFNGGTLVLQDNTLRFDPKDVLQLVEREKVTALSIVGDAFAHSILTELRSAGSSYRLESLRYIFNGGAVLSPANKIALRSFAPDVQIIDILGSSESGRQATGSESSGSDLSLSLGTVVLNDSRDGLLNPGPDSRSGWLAKGGHIPLGYLGDEAKTHQTFPSIGGDRYVVPGDRVILKPTGAIKLLGRDSATINTAGEKVFAAEVELALKSHPSVVDVLVIGRPSTRWGQEVVAVAEIADDVTNDSVLAVAENTLARFKLPKKIIRVGQVQRSASGKPDYKWARKVASGHLVPRDYRKTDIALSRFTGFVVPETRD